MSLDQTHPGNVMTRCYVIPGIAGSSLLTSSGIGGELWVSVPRLALGQVGKLRLAADGVSPGGPDGVEISVGVPLVDYYGPLIAALTAALDPHGYTVLGWGYDWRRSCMIAGAELADEIRGHVMAGDPCALVAHSQGGLVSRVAWHELGLTQQQNLVRRIITLGTPHQGSYSPVRLWSLEDETLEQLSALSSWTNLAIDVTGFLMIGHSWSLIELAALAATWPSLYEMMPFGGGSAQADDPNRPYSFSAANWPVNRQISQAHMDHASGPWQTLMGQASTLPPPDILTTVAGSGYVTPYRLTVPSLLGDPAALSSNIIGDGRVTVTSALVPQSVQFVVNSLHGDLQNAANRAGELAAAILEVRAPPTVPPAVTVTLTDPGPHLAGPPLPANPGVPRHCPSYCCH